MTNLSFKNQLLLLHSHQQPVYITPTVTDTCAKQVTTLTANLASIHLSVSVQVKYAFNQCNKIVIWILNQKNGIPRVKVFESLR